MEVWLSTSHLYQVTNGDFVAAVCWWIAILILVEIPRVAWWTGKVCDALNIR